MRRKSLHNRLREIAEAEVMSLKQVVTLAIADKMATLATLDCLEERAKRASREKLLTILEKAPDVEPEDYDSL